MGIAAYDVLDENERLQKEIERLRGDLEYWVAEHAIKQVTLEIIAKEPPATLDEPDTDWEVIKKMRALALRALSHPNQTEPNRG